VGRFRPRPRERVGLARERNCPSIFWSLDQNISTGSEPLNWRPCLNFPAFIKFGAMAILCGLALAVPASAYFAPAANHEAGSASSGADEFVGPFSSWSNLKRDYGAIGDGVADDTEALQEALNELGQGKHSATLFIPKGVYRITKGLTMTSQMDVAVLGEDPASTIIRYDGPDGGTMLYCNGVRYSRFGRLTWDGAGHAETAVSHKWDGHTPNANSHNEHADEFFQDVGYGIRAGVPHFMDAECAVLRCHFLRCSKAGVSIESFNALDWWLWYCTFTNCRIGVTNDAPGAGHFHVYNSVFRNSAEADMTMRNTSNYFGIRNNLSIGSKAFFLAANAGNNGASVTMQGNTIIDPTDASCVRFFSMGPLILLDNVFRTSQSPAVLVGKNTPLVSVGNTFTAAGSEQGGFNSRQIDDKVVPAGSIAVPMVTLPDTAVNYHRPIVELPAGSDAAAIQNAINLAAASHGVKPVIHLPPGTYQVDRTLVVPANCDLQMAGDGYRSVLKWSGHGAGPVLRLEGPSRAILRDFTVDGAGTVEGVAVENSDQAGARIFMEQGEATGAETNDLLVDGLAHANVELHDFYHEGSRGVSVQVNGASPSSGDLGPAGRVAIFGGASSGNALSYGVENGGRLVVEDIWYEGSPPGFLDLTGAGSFTLDGAEISPGRPGPNMANAHPDFGGVEVDDFKGDAAILAAQFGTKVSVHGDGSQTNFLLLGDGGVGAAEIMDASPHAHFAQIASNAWEDGVGCVTTPDIGTADPAWLLRMLAPLRAAHPLPLTMIPPGVTDLRAYRFKATNCTIGIHLYPGTPPGAG